MSVFVILKKYVTGASETLVPSYPTTHSTAHKTVMSAFRSVRT
jgi:hypothetical protein